MSDTTVTSTLRAEIGRLLEQHPDWTSTEVAEAMVRSRTESAVRSLAFAYLKEVTDSVLRSTARKVEDRAARYAPPPQTTTRWTPTSPSTPPTPPAKAYVASSHTDNLQRLVAGASWRSDVGGDFEALLAEAKACGCEECIVVSRNSVDDLSRRFDWSEAEAERRNKWGQERNARYKAELDKIMADWKHSIRLEVTEELLGSDFALGDGRRVTWAEATVADHEQRVAMLETSAVGTLETAARHRAAIEMLRRHGVKTLAEVNSEVAA